MYQIKTLEAQKCPRMHSYNQDRNTGPPNRSSVLAPLRLQGEMELAKERGRAALLLSRAASSPHPLAGSVGRPGGAHLPLLGCDCHSVISQFLQLKTCSGPIHSHWPCTYKLERDSAGFRATGRHPGTRGGGKLEEEAARPPTGSDLPTRVLLLERRGYSRSHGSTSGKWVATGCL